MRRKRTAEPAAARTERRLRAPFSLMAGSLAVLDARRGRVDDWRRDGKQDIDMDERSDLRAAVRTIPDYPKPGILFRDITTLLGDARAFRRAVDELVQPWPGSKIDKVAGIEARGFIL